MRPFARAAKGAVVWFGLHNRSVLALAVVLVLFLQLSGPLLDDVESWRVRATKNPIGFIAVYVTVQTATIVLAPIGGYIPQVAMYALFGPLWGSIIVYLVSTPVYVINFVLARKYREKIVGVLVGTAWSKRVAWFVGAIDTSSLTLLRVHQASFDVVAYAAGLSRVGLRTFILVDVLAGVLTIPFTYVIFTFVPELRVATALHWTLILCAGGIIGWRLHRTPPMA